MRRSRVSITADSSARLHQRGRRQVLRRARRRGARLGPSAARRRGRRGGGRQRVEQRSEGEGIGLAPVQPEAAHLDRAVGGDDQLRRTLGPRERVGRRRGRVELVAHRARDAGDGLAGEFAPVATRPEAGLARQQPPQRLAQRGGRREVERGRRDGGVDGRWQLAGMDLQHPGGQRRRRRRCALRREQRGEVDAAQAKDQERVAVDLAAEQVDHRCEVLARHRPVGAGAVHLQVAPALRKDRDAPRLRRVQHGRVELAVEQPRDQPRVRGQPRRVGRGHRRHLDVHRIRPRTRALHPGADAVAVDDQVEHRAAPGVAAPARQAVVMVDLGQRLQPLRTPPGAAVGRAVHGVGVASRGSLRARAGDGRRRCLRQVRPAAAAPVTAGAQACSGTGCNSGAPRASGRRRLPARCSAPAQGDRPGSRMDAGFPGSGPWAGTRVGTQEMGAGAAL